MRAIFLTLLTTLFVSAMPLHAAYATADDAPVKEACSVSYDKSITDAVREEVKAAGGSLVELSGDNASAFLSKLEEMMGSPAPFTVDQVVIVRPIADEDAMLNVGFFKDNCLVHFMHLPSQVLIQLAPNI